MSNLIIMVAYRIKHPYGIPGMEHERIVEIDSLLLTDFQGHGALAIELVLCLLFFFFFCVSFWASFLTDDDCFCLVSSLFFSNCVKA